VWMFPLKLFSQEPPMLPEEQIGELRKSKEREARGLDNDELKRRAEKSSIKAGSRRVSSTQYDRSVWVAEYVKRRANGICQLCSKPAPFIKQTGEPYLETHHIVWLSKGGEDTIRNAVALCPNCHRRMHILDRDGDKNKLLKLVNPE
jgi:5-methylcytosine-specific restriction protein A